MSFIHSFEFELGVFFCKISLYILLYFVKNQFDFFLEDGINGLFFIFIVGFKRIFVFFSKILIYILLKAIFFFVSIFFIFIFSIFWIDENLLYQKQYLFKQYDLLFDEHRWEYYYKRFNDAKLKKTRGIIYFKLTKENQPKTFETGLKLFFYKLIVILMNFWRRSNKNKYRVWKWAGYISKKPSIRYNKFRLKLSKKKNFHHYRHLNYYQDYRLRFKISRIKKFLKPNMSFLDSLYIFIAYREEYALLLAQEQLEDKLQKIKDKFGERLYEHLLLREDHKQAIVIRMKLKSTDKFKEVLPLSESESPSDNEKDLNKTDLNSSIG